MEIMDRVFVKRPYFGARRLGLALDEAGCPACRSHVRRLMRVMRIEAIYPKPRLSAGNQANRVYPYLLGGLIIDRPDQVWATDITYIPLKHGFAYLTAVMDWASRYVLSWELSLSLEGGFCLAALESALTRGAPGIFNTDQGCQFTAGAFTGRLLAAGVRVSMDGKGRCFDNIFTERLWRTVKYEDVYLKGYGTYFEAQIGLGEYFSFYNEERWHSGVGNRTPASVYWDGRPRVERAG